MPPPIPLLFGPMLIGGFFNTMLYGVLVIQSLTYFQTFKRDSLWLKCFAFYLLVAETVNTGLIIGLLYEPLILKYGQPAATKFLPVLLPSDPIMTVAVSTPVQLFIVWRIIVISGKYYFPLIIGFFSIVSTGGAIWLAHTVVVVKVFARKPELHWPALTWLIASMIADVIITVSLVHSLAKRKTGFVQTDDIINRIIRMTVQTGLITAIFAILDVVCFLVVPNSTLNFVWDFALSKLYTNALMSTLNARSGFGAPQSQGRPTNVLFTEGSFTRDGNKAAGFRLSLAGKSKPMDSLLSRRTADDVEGGISPVKMARDI